MVEHKKLYRVFQLISRLRSPFGASKSDLARDFDVSERTIERYFVLLKELGFEVEKKNEFFSIKRIDKYQVKPEDLIVFSLEEAGAIKDAILNSPIQSPLQKSLLSKLYALTDIDDISETLYRQGTSKNISIINRCIRNKQQVLLKGYHSVRSKKVSDRLVEPIKFFSYYLYLLAFEVSSGKVKQFKIDRITSAEETGRAWLHERKHGSKRIDFFGMSGSDPIEITLKLTTRSRSLLEEEHPGADASIWISDGVPYFQGVVYSFEGIGRFILGLIDEVEVIQPHELKDYVNQKVNSWLSKQEMINSISE